MKHRFSVLGVLSVSDGHEIVELRPSKPATLLATLLLHPNESVSVNALQRAVWGDTPPLNGRAMVQTCVLRLRRLLAKFGIESCAIESLAGGYRIPATAETLDLVEFRELARSARNAPSFDTELNLLRRALALWRGTPLANIRSEVLERDEVPRICEERLATYERMFDIELILGRHKEALPPLRALTVEHPAHEPFWRQLVESLYRSGRQADALAEYRRLKTYLRDALGIDPSPESQALELGILRGDLDNGNRVERPGRGDATSRQDPPRRLLPADLPTFTGRSAEVAALREQLTAGGTSPLVAVISGPPGVGKTTLALHVAHLVRDHFPDGQWLSVLRTADGAGDPRAAAADLLRRVGSTADAAGDDAPARLRETLEERRVLLLLDGVDEPEQVLPLLPTCPGSAVIITSNKSLVGVVARRGGRVYRLGAFDTAESHQMLAALLGADRVADQHDALRDICEQCGHYPIVLRIIAARLLARPHLRLRDCANWLRSTPLHRLLLGPSSVNGTAAVSIADMVRLYLEQLGTNIAEAFVTLAGSGVDELSVEACAELLGTSPLTASELLDALVEANLVEEDFPDRYAFHTMLRSAASALRSRDTAIAG